MVLGLIVAISQNGVIGVEGRIPWHYPEDMRRFKRITWGSTIIMGRTTWESLPKRPLPGRRNVVITRTPIPEVDCFESIELALADLDQQREHEPERESDVWFIGGAQLYRDALRHAEVIDVTHVPDVVVAANVVQMPPIDPDLWTAGPRVPHETDSRLEIQRFTKKSPRSSTSESA